ncbi:MAG: 23S rRNA (adenine(2503)-C(2))-methyltransferase RlmN [Saprospiraceae bacterium]|nr:23S rRNA (adenine(2503)-C(2))-methyltransferase RlmN [Saprospiraceae bacterium]
MEIEKKDLLNIDPVALQTELTGLGWEKYRTAQLLDWLWKKSVRSFEEMTNLSKAQRQQLSDLFFIPALQLEKQQLSSDGTMKFKFLTFDGYPIESVLIPVEEEERFTVCVSSQSGCSLSCAFCATGTMGLLKNLTASEIFDQYMLVNKACIERYGKPISNIVYMGMGEPLLNYRQVIASIERLSSKAGPGLSPKRITVSTAGIAKMIRKLADDEVRVNLALSLHAADDVKRNSMMAINESNHLSSLVESLKYFYKKTGNRISYEYIAFEGFNDTIQDAKNLIRLCSHFPVRVNIIEYNPVAGMEFVKSSEDRINTFAQEVRKHGIMITLRRSRGKDIDAACGQLAVKE